MVKEYIRFLDQYIALLISNQYTKVKDKDIEVHFLSLSINNILGNLHKYQKLLPYFPTYETSIAINLNFC